MGEGGRFAKPTVKPKETVRINEIKMKNEGINKIKVRHLYENIALLLLL